MRYIGDFTMARLKRKELRERAFTILTSRDNTYTGKSFFFPSPSIHAFSVSPSRTRTLLSFFTNRTQPRALLASSWEGHRARVLLPRILPPSGPSNWRSRRVDLTHVHHCSIRNRWLSSMVVTFIVHACNIRQRACSSSVSVRRLQPSPSFQEKNGRNILSMSLDYKLT